MHLVTSYANLFFYHLANSNSNFHRKEMKMSDTIEFDDDFYWDTLHLADDLYDQGKYEEAEELYRKIAGEEDLSGDANSHLFQLLLDVGKYEEAVEYYRYVQNCCDTSPAEGAYLRMAEELHNPKSPLFMYFDEEEFYYDCLPFISEDYVCLDKIDDEDGNCDNVEAGELYLKNNIETILLTRAKSEDEAIKKDAKYQLLWLYLNGKFRVGDFSFDSPDAKNFEKVLQASVVFAQYPDTIDELYCDVSYFLTVIYDIYENYGKGANEYIKRFVIATLKHAEELGNIDEVFDKVERELCFLYDDGGFLDMPFSLNYLPKGISRISVITFSAGYGYGDKGLESIVIPDTITTIGDRAFFGCSSLTSVVIPASVTSIGTEVFSGCDSLTSIAVDENNENYKSVDGNLYSKDGKTLIQYALGKKNEEFIIPTGVTSIGENSFLGCASLTRVTIPDSVTSIGDYAFCACENLTSITVTDSVTNIGDWSFADSDNLVSVFLSRSEDDFANVKNNLWNGWFVAHELYFYSAEQPSKEGNYWHYVDGVPTVW